MGVDLTWSNIDAQLTAYDNGTGYTEADLIKLVKDSSVKVEGAPTNATSFLYSGVVNGKDSFEVAEALVTATQNESGANRYVRIDETPAGQLLQDKRFTKFYQNAIRARLMADPVIKRGQRHLVF